MKGDEDQVQNPTPTLLSWRPIEYVLASGVYWVAVIVLDISAVVALTHGLAVFRYGQHPA